MTTTLYGFGKSRSFRCLWALSEAQIEHDYINIDLSSDAEDGVKGPKYLALNSQGKVPTLVHNDLVLTESAAILNYINAIADGSFIPADPISKAKYDELCFFVLAELEQPLWTTGKHRFAIPEQHRVAAIFPTAHWEFAKALNALDKMVSLENFALGDTFSFADILIAHTIGWAQGFKFEVPEKFAGYHQRMFEREAAVKATNLLPS